MTREAFERLVEEALASLPRKFRRHIHNVAVVVEDAPSAEDLAAVGLTPSDTLLGLYQGVPLKERDLNYHHVLPDRIVIYQRPMEALSRDPEELKQMVRDTVIHELGHYFGLSDAEMAAWEAEP